jgi:transcriptional regulator with XRE-family HTH domain
MNRSRKATTKGSRAATTQPASPPAKQGRGLSLAGYLRRQRSLADISLRKIIERSGIPGVVLKELEGGLQHPSQTMLQSLAGALRLSAETLYLQAGVLDPRDVGVRRCARSGDPHLTEHQRAIPWSRCTRRPRSNRAPKEESAAAMRRTRSEAPAWRGILPGSGTYWPLRAAERR